MDARVETPAPEGEGAALARLRAQLQQRARVPDLPAGWEHQSAVVAAGGYESGGDFIVAELSTPPRSLQMVLVDVCGHGAAAVPAALRFAGALQGLVPALPPGEVLGAANGYLLRQPSDESIATAVHVEIDLHTGDFRIRSAGHPPALRWESGAARWLVDNARGTALGVSERPEIVESHGTLAPGDALLFYTDGVVESRSEDIDVGIAWLQDTARLAVRQSWAGAARRIVEQVSRGEDDRAVLILQRT